MFVTHLLMAASAVLVALLSFAVTVRSHRRFSEAEARELELLG